MSVELISNNHLPVLNEVLKTVDKEINIISPFISIKMVKSLCELLKKNSNVSCTLITRFYRDDFLSGASDISALKLLLENNVKVFLLKGLHSKVYLFDNNVGMLGSANFTSGGFISNHELSIIIKNEDKIISDMHDYFDNVLKLIQKAGDYMLTLQMIINEKIVLNNKRAENPNNGEGNKKMEFGAEIKLPSCNSKKSLIYSPSTTFFLKPIGVTEKPFKIGRTILDDRLYFSKRFPRAVKRGSIIICYGVGTRKLLGYYESVSDEAIIDPTPNDERWPHYVDSKCLSTAYSKEWWNYELNLSELKERFMFYNPNKEITYNGSKSLGSLNWGSDKIRISHDFAHFLIEQINNCESNCKIL